MFKRQAMRASIILFLALSCTSRYVAVPCETYLTCINIIDQNGTSETISNLDRLQRYAEVDFLKPQPYQKVLRVFNRDACGDLPSIITSYYPNGVPNQYLEVVNGRAKGTYLEWFSDGTQKISAYVIGGAADLTKCAEETWLFDGLNRAWDEEGRLVAELEYNKGDLHGTSIYYHKNGNPWKRVSCQRGKIEGIVEIFLENGTLFQTIAYTQGIKNGPSIRYWCEGSIASEECYCMGKLINGQYRDREGKKVGGICEGTGIKAVFGKESITELQEYREGHQEGMVKVFAKNGGVVQTYFIKNACKHGEEYWYYEPLTAMSKPRPKLLLTWYEGKIQGPAKTWFPNGNMESQREMSNNTKNGLSTAWYEDGNLMLIEEYEKDKIVKGEYYKKGDFLPVSQVIDGRGTATLFDPDGSFLRKVEYIRGIPQEPA